MYKTHIEFGAIPWDEGAKFGILLELVYLKYWNNWLTVSWTWIEDLLEVQLQSRNGFLRTQAKLSEVALGVGELH